MKTILDIFGNEKVQQLFANSLLVDGANIEKAAELVAGKPAYDKLASKVEDAIKERTERAAHAAIELDGTEAREQLIKMGKQVGRLVKIEERLASPSHWDHFKGNLRRVHYSLRYAAR